MTAPGLLPITARTGPRGIQVGGCDLVDLAHQFGTPLHVYDEQDIRHRCRDALAAFPDGVSYAAKAFLCLAVAQLVHEEGLRLDVSSGGELAIALAAGIPGDRLVVHGNNKSMPEIESALTAGAQIVIDSDDEITRLEHAPALRHVRPHVLIRVNPAVTAATHAHVQTGHLESKFGFRLDDAAGAAAQRLRDSGRVHLDGVHVHVGSQLMDLSAITSAVTRAARFAADLDAGELSIGGGLGVAHTSQEAAPSMDQWATAARGAALLGGFRGRIVAEPGRAIVSRAGLTLYTIGTIKQVTPDLTYLAVDGGLSDNPRPALYGSTYQPFLPRAPRPTGTPEPESVFRVVGKNCESGDVLVHAARLPSLAVDDVLALPVTGAYVHSMSSQYNGLPRPAVVFVRDGRPRLVVARDTTDDLLRGQQPLNPAPTTPHHD